MDRYLNERGAASFLWIVSFLAIAVGVMLWARPSSSQESAGQLFRSEMASQRQEGRIFAIEISRRNPIRIFVVGREEAKLDPSSLTLTVRRLKPYPAKVLRVDRQDGYFFVSEPSDSLPPKEIEVKASSSGKQETFNFEIRTEKP